VHEIWGLSIVTEDNEVQKRGTLIEVLKGAATGWPKNLQRYWEVTERFGPELVISDFETWSAYYGHNHMLPVICLDNIQAVRRLWHPPEILAGRKSDWRMTKAIIKAKIPTARHYLITSFFDAPTRLERTTVVPPILRQEILDATPSEGDHILVYQTSDSFSGLADQLRAIDLPFRIYGLRRDIDADVVDENMTFRPFSEAGFIDDLASCKGVIASAGFTLVGEALHLGKPYLATPVRGQFEQVMNGRYIDHLGYGIEDECLDEFTVQAFINHLDGFKEALASYPRSDNEEMFDQLRAQIEASS